ncbi:hypothetical protein [Mucilaginibacter sp. FT3.2]|uniref:hypothetical protein n=1 Tax=Mucilaginibacter sp. FT3.2 TaxID=2723090 RepID=UPI0016225FBD|nr:hypothetical protein [Mucilaginibacter sp. FT3.2]MBB6230763.1 hypothetical protein [Mucilaginibacter sp. FT3.2]
MNVIFNDQMLNENATPPQIKTTINCPRCKNNFCQRIPRGASVKLILPWMSLKHYYCDRCFKKFYKLNS